MKIKLIGVIGAGIVAVATAITIEYIKCELKKKDILCKS